MKLKNYKYEILTSVYAGSNQADLTQSLYSLQLDGVIEAVVCYIDGPIDPKMRSILSEYLQDKQIITCPYNRGLAEVLNEAILKSNVDYIIKFDSDDIWESGRMSRLHKYLRDINLNFIISTGDIKVWNVDTNSISLRAARRRIINSGINHPNMLINVEKWRKYNILYTNYQLREDWALYLNLIRLKLLVRYDLPCDVIMKVNTDTKSRRRNWAVVKSEFNIWRYEKLSVSQQLVIFLRIFYLILYILANRHRQSIEN